MGAGQSDLYKGTYGDDSDNIPDLLKGKIKLPPNDAQIKHIFRDEEGHLPDTPENRKMIYDLANDYHYYVNKDKHGNNWNVRYNDDGSQDWVRYKNMTINEGGKNMIPRPWDPETGLFHNVKKAFRRKRNE